MRGSKGRKRGGDGEQDKGKGARRQARRPQSDRGLVPLLPSLSSSPSCLPEASKSLESLQKPLTAFRFLWGLSQTQGRCSPCSPHPCLIPFIPLTPSPHEPPWTPAASESLWEPLEAFSSLRASDSRALFSLLSLAP